MIGRKNAQKAQKPETGERATAVASARSRAYRRLSSRHRPPVFCAFLRPLLLVCLALVPFAAPSSAASAPPPNVILILADDLALGDLASLNGGRTRTPHLDRLIASGLWFDRATSASAVCAPARAALLTGRFPHRTGVVSLNMRTEPALTRLHRGETTLADLFVARGYRTGLVGKWHVGLGDEWHPRRRGFAEFAGFAGDDNIKSYDDYTLEIDGAPRRFTDRYLTDALTDRAIDFVRRHRTAPFFLHLAHYAPHRPLGAPAALVKSYTDRGFPENTATVYAMVEILDRGIGALLATLDELGLRERTLVIFASDNGPDPLAGPRFNHDRRGAKYDVFEGGIRVPLVFAWPGTVAPGRSEFPAHFTDLLPTLADLCGLGRPALPVDGVSFAAHLRGAPAPAAPVRYWQWNRAAPNYTHNLAVRDGEWKLVRPPVTRNQIAGDSTAAPALYHLPSDPGEATDLSARHPDRLARLQAAADAWTAAIEADRTRPNR